MQVRVVVFRDNPAENECHWLPHQRSSSMQVKGLESSSPQIYGEHVISNIVKARLDTESQDRKKGC